MNTSPTGRVEGARSTASDRWQATPSVRPYRPFAALALARRTDPLLFSFFLEIYLSTNLSPLLTHASR